MFARTLAAVALLLATILYAVPSWADDPPAPPPVEEAVPDDATPPTGDDAAAAETDAPDDALPASPPASNDSEAELTASPPPVPETPWSLGLITSMVALSIGGISAVLGIWIDRDKTRPIIFAYVMSVLIISAVTVGLAQSYMDATAAIQQKEDLTRMLSMVHEIAQNSGDQELIDLLNAESAQ